MRILLLSHYFPPEVNAPASRAFDHATAWAASGHDVTIVTCVPHHPMGRVYPGYKNRLWSRETRDGVTIIRLLTYITANEGFARRTANYVFYLIMTTLAAPFLGKADIVISTSPQFFNGLAGWPISRLKRAPWVVEIRDLWPESILAVGAIRSRWIIDRLVALERFMYRRADHVVIVSEAFRDHICAVSGRRAKITWLPNGINMRLISENQKNRDFRARHGLGDRFIAAYVGTHGLAHGLDTVLDAAERLRAYPDIVLLLVGDGAEKVRLEQVCTARGLDNVVMLPQLPKSTIPELWSAVDIGLVTLKATPVFRTVIPTKMLESLAHGTPVILSVQGEAARLLTESEGGMAIPPENADALANAILTLKRDPETRREMARRGRAYIARYFDRAEIARRYELLLSRTSPSRPAARTVRALDRHAE